MTNWREDMEFQQAFREYLLEHNMKFDEGFVYKSGIDCVFVYLYGKPVFIVGLPPPSYYSVDETEYTDKYLRAAELVAV